ncbi:hypothetical protein [Amycolatopsis cihanbeyliensis]|uniref:hypothetical protein n=1 Tax=Amycolatopsis cihanbeyliensis TaxID=1128664 RepID=UPI001476DE8A|nr:hypothetical protein [Amycolatopsis cihanbeyliensis]
MVRQPPLRGDVDGPGRQAQHGVQALDAADGVGIALVAAEVTLGLHAGCCE